MHGSPGAFPYPNQENPLMSQLAQYMEVCGRANPLHKIYVTTEPLDHLAVLCCLFVLSVVPAFSYDARLGEFHRSSGAASLCACLDERRSD